MLETTCKEEVPSPVIVKPAEAAAALAAADKNNLSDAEALLTLTIKLLAVLLSGSVNVAKLAKLAATGIKPPTEVATEPTPEVPAPFKSTTAASLKGLTVTLTVCVPLAPDKSLTEIRI